MPVMAWLIDRAGSRLRGHELDGAVVTVGSAEDARVRLHGPGVAAHHCQVVRTGQGHRVIDLGGGVAVNGRRTQEANLDDGDLVQIGELSLTFRTDPEFVPAPVQSLDAYRTARARGTTSVRASLLRRFTSGLTRRKRIADVARAADPGCLRGLPNTLWTIAILSAVGVIVVLLMKVLQRLGH
jgi:FHA domain-containing protein